MPGEHKQSGGKRATERRHAEREAARERGGEGGTDDWNKHWIAEAKAVEQRDTPEGMFAELSERIMLLVRESMEDIGLPPEQRRSRTATLIQVAVKALDPARLALTLVEHDKIIDELRERLRERAGRNAGAIEVPAAAPGGARAAPPQ